jgi:hypothetical protein
VRSYQEKEKEPHGTVQNALEANDPLWRERELIVLPSHVHDCSDDIDEMIETAQTTGFDAICATLIMTGNHGDDRRSFAEIWGKNWNERWTLPNAYIENWQEQVEAIGRDLWTRVCRALAS